MSRLLLLFVVFLFMAVAVSSEVFSQEKTDTQTSVTGDEKKELDEDKDEIDLPSDLSSKFDQTETAPLELGDASDRVRELQASLNFNLQGQVISLGQPIYVGPPRGPRSEVKHKVRLVLSSRQEKAFQIRGNWEPLKADGETALDFAPGSERLKMTYYLRLPPEPLKVDGVFGQHTRAAVAVFQLQQALPVTGVVDVVTLDKLEPMVPTNPLLAMVMKWVRHATIGPFHITKEDDNYPYWVKTCTSVIVTFLILATSLVVLQCARMLAKSTRFLTHWLFTPSSSPWFTSLRKNNVFLLSAQFAPGLFIYFAALAIFPAPDETKDSLPYLNTFQNWHDFVSHLGLAYVSLVLMLVGFAVANTFDSVYNPDQQTENPISSIIRASKRLIGLVGTLLICASLAGRSPFVIVGGLGAFMAVFMLVFRDYLLGLVASVQIIANRVVKIGDWVTMPKYNADGDVKEISLSLIKVQNFDKTISTIPTNSVLSQSFRNWTGMQTAGGRRIKRAVLIDMFSIRVCTPEMLGRFEQIELIRDYIKQKKGELEEYNRTHDIDASTVNSRRLTNIGTFRAYLEAYLRNHPGLIEEMTFLVRHLQPTSNGLPIEIYAFCNETAWAKYEAVQADIFDHVLAILPEFELRVFQEVTDLKLESPEDSWSPEHRTAFVEIKGLIDKENQLLANNPNDGIGRRVKKVKKKIRDLGLADRIAAEGSGRTITLKHLHDS